MPAPACVSLPTGSGSPLRLAPRPANWAWNELLEVSLEVWLRPRSTNLKIVNYTFIYSRRTWLGIGSHHNQAMDSDFLVFARTLTDDELQARAKSLAARARDATAQLVAHLVEIEARGLHLAAGYSSLFAYCRGVLSLSENETYNRIAAARVASRFPVILERLAQGAVNLTTVSLLAPHLTPANHLEALESARGLRKSEVEELVARLAPKPDVPASLRKLPAPQSAEPQAPAHPGVPAPAAAESSPASPTPTAPIATATAARALTPLSPDRYKL